MDQLYGAGNSQRLAVLFSLGKKDPELKEIKVELDFGDEINLECDQNEFEPNEDFKGEMITEIIDKLKTMEDKY